MAFLDTGGFSIFAQYNVQKLDKRCKCLLLDVFLQE